MHRISGNIWPVPGTPGTRPGTRKRPYEAPFNTMFPVFPVKIHFPYKRARNIPTHPSTQIKFRAYRSAKQPGTPGTPGTLRLNSLAMRFFVFPDLFPVLVVFPVFIRNSGRRWSR